MLDDTIEDTTARVRALARAEIRAASVEPTDALIGQFITSMLRQHDAGHAEWLRTKGSGCIGHITEVHLPSGEIALLGDQRLFQRYPNLGPQGAQRA